MIMVFGALLVALLVTTMSEYMKLYPNEKKAFNEIEEQYSAAIAIQSALKKAVLLKKRYESDSSSDTDESKIERNSTLSYEKNNEKTEDSKPTFKDLKKQYEQTAKKAKIFSEIHKRRSNQNEISEILFFHTEALQDL